jgi:predicted ester cyclase
MSTTSNVTDDKATCIRHLEAMATGSLDDMAEVVAPDATNREARKEPPAARGRGPEAFHATAEWLRAAHSDLRWEVHEAVQDGDLVVLHATMTGRHTGTFTAYDEDAAITMAFPPSGRSFSATQTHWFRMRDGKIIEHWANRDDMTMGQQLGRLPPTPIYLAKMLLARRRARRAAKD